MVPKHLLQLIFLSVICISSFKILELRFRYELYDSNKILGKESQEQSKAWFRAKMGHLGSVQAARLQSSAILLKHPTTFEGIFSHFHGEKIKN